jgi:release factor glutamine methyltransferase
MNEAEILFTEVLKCSRASLYLDRGALIGARAGRRISSVLKRRAAGESLYYILGKIEFMGLEFRVTPDVLVPRPETELLVEAAVSYAAVDRSPGAPLNILDIGTGSGCIAISMARMLEAATITATDISHAALDVARTNARDLCVNDRIRFVCCDMFPCQSSKAGSYDIIVSNPPYIRTGDIAGLQPEVRSEPSEALDGGADGLDFYRAIISSAHRYLRPRGALLLELGFDQAHAVRQLIEDSKNFRVKEVIRDYNDIQRVIVATKD